MSSDKYDYDVALFGDKTKQSAVIGEPTDDSSAIYRSMTFPAPDKFVQFPFERDDSKPTIKTMWDAWEYGVKQNGSKDCYGFRPFIDEKNRESRFEYLTYSQCMGEVQKIIGGLQSLNLTDENGEQPKVGIFAVNRMEWVWSALAVWHENHCAIPLYDTLGEEAIQFIIEQTNMQAMFTEVSKLDRLWKTFDEMKNTDSPVPLKYVIYFDYRSDLKNKHEKEVSASHFEAAAKHGVQLLSLTDFAAGKPAEAKEYVPSKPEDLAYIMYTSGTTGQPKGVMISQGNLLCVLALFAEPEASVGVTLDNNDKYLSYLPLAHSFETVFQFGLLVNGCRIAFYSGDARKILDDFKVLQPTILCGVPRVYQKVYDKVQAARAEAGWLKALLMRWAFNSGISAYRSGGKSNFWDKIIFSKIRATAGWGDLRMIVSGAAPLPGYLMEFLGVVTGVHVAQGYGMTETATTGTLTLKGDRNVGHVGVPTAACEIKLVDVPEMNYLHTNPHPTGEIWIRGPGVFSGYYRNEEKTKEALEDGWIKTGDIGRINPNGTLSIIDRKKNIFKLAQGEYIAVEKIEAAYMKSPTVNQLWVYGNSFKSFLLAVVVPQFSWVFDLGKEKQWFTGDVPAPFSEKARDLFKKLVDEHYDEIHKLVLDDMVKHGSGDLKGFERIRDIHLESSIGELMTGFYIENDLLTPSMKIRRVNMLNKYRPQLKALYAKNGEAPNEHENW